MNKLCLSIIVPTFNEEETLRFSHQRLSNLRNSNQLAKFDTIELIYVNDGSTDKTSAILADFLKPILPGLAVRTLHLSRNFGHSAAVVAGLEVQTGNVTAIIDADLQDSPELIPQMVAQLIEGVDVVYGQRMQRQGESAFKKFTAWFFYRLLASLTRIAIPKDTGDFRVMTREVADAVLACKEHDPFLRGLVAWVGFNQIAFPYNREPRKMGSTKYTFRKMLRFASVAIVSFSSFPLRLALYLGVFGMIASIGLGFWAIGQHIQGRTLPGWASLFVVFSLSQSIILFVLGVIGVYIGRLHIESQARPRYVVRTSPPKGLTSNVSPETVR